MTAPTSPALSVRPETEGRAVVREPGPMQLDGPRFRRRRRMIDVGLRWGTPVLIFVAWQLLATSGLLDPQFWPAPSAIVVELVKMVQQGILQQHVLVTTDRLLLGYVVGSLIGVVLGFLLGSNRWLRVALEPVISALYTVPKLAIFPLLLVLFGIGETPKIILTALAAFFIVCISTVSAVVTIPEPMREPLRSWGANGLQTFRHLTLPAVLPAIFVALRLGAGMTVLVLVGTEMIQGADGLGYLIWSSWQIYDTERMYVGIVVTALYGAAFQWLIQLLGRLLTPWESDVYNA